jgi:flagellar hook-associated protein 2
VQQYNKVREQLDALTFFDETENTTGILFGSSEALRVEVDLADLITRRYFGAGSIQSLSELGLRLDADGELLFDEQQFQSTYAESPEAVQQFFTQSEFGAVDRVVQVVEQLAGEDHSLLVNRLESLGRTIDDHDQRILDLTLSLEREREQLLNHFYQLEAVIGRMQTQMDALAQLQPVAPLSLNS